MSPLSAKEGEALRRLLMSERGIQLVHPYLGESEQGYRAEAGVPSKVAKRVVQRLLMALDGDSAL